MTNSLGDFPYLNPYPLGDWTPNINPCPPFYPGYTPTVYPTPVSFPVPYHPAIPIATGPNWPPFPPKPTIPDRKPKLYITLGCQRSGKSTLGRKWLRREISFDDSGCFGSDDNYPRYMWDSDLLRLEMHGRAYCRESEPMVFAVKNYAIRAALSSGSDVVVCGTHTSKSSIRRMLEIRRDLIPVVVDTDVDTCLQRAIDTGQGYLINVIPRVHRQLRGLLAEGLDKVIDGILDDIDNKVPY